MTDVRYPVMQSQAVPHGINIHQVAHVSPALLRLKSLGIYPELSQYHYAFGRPEAIRSDVPARQYVDQVEMVLPPIRHVRPIWNLHSFNADGKWVSPDIAIWKEFAARGWKILLTMFDGPTQRSWGWQGRGGVQAAMDGWKRRHAYGWTKMMEALAEHGLLDAIYAYEPLNEPNGYNSLDNSGLASQARAVWHYTEHCKAIWDIALSFNPDPHLIMSGWRWNASMGPLSRVPIPEYGGLSAMDHLAQRYPGKQIYGSVHLGEEITQTLTPKDYYEYFSQSNLEKKSDWRFNPNQLFATELLGFRDNGISDVPVNEDPRQHLHIKNMDGWYYFGISQWYWPFSNFSKSRLIDLQPNGIPRDFYRSIICAVTTTNSYPNRPEWFHGPQQGIKDEASPDSISIVQESNYGRAESEAGWAASQPLPAQARLTRVFGGKGTCVLNLPARQFTGAFGGDGWTVVYGQDSSWDTVYFGRGGGVSRLGAGLNFVTTRWNRCRVYAGAGHNAIWCFTGETTFPPVNALHHETTAILHPAGTHYLFDWHRCHHKVSFMGAFPTPDALRAAARLIPSTLPAEWSHDLWIDLPGGGSVQMAFGRECMAKLVSHCRDFADGWYRPGWTEPADYAPAELSAPLVDPGPAYDALYVWQGGQSPLFDHNGEQLEIRLWNGEPGEISLWGAA